MARRLAPLALLVLLATVSDASAQVVINPFFETGNLAPYSGFATANGGLTAGPTIVSYDFGSGPVYAAELQAGRVSGVGQRGGGVIETFSVGTAGTYAFTLGDVAVKNLTSSSVFGGTVILDIDGSTIGGITLTPSLAAGATYTDVTTPTFSTTLTAGSHTVDVAYITTTAPGTTDVFLQGVSGRFASVPEPGPLALASVAALGGLVATLRRRRPAHG